MSITRDIASHDNAVAYGGLIDAIGGVATIVLVICGLVGISPAMMIAIATIVFGVSRNFWLSFMCLAATGAGDTVRMVFRGLLRQLETPDRLRGRMTGVNMVFFMGGPQLGELEAGAVANWLGAPFSVISGGIGCLVCTAWVALVTPALRRYRREPREATAVVP